jgi:hypothetical protein
MDADHGNLPIMDINPTATSISISDNGPGLSGLDAFAVGGSQRRDGHHGLGLKDAIAVFMRANVELRILTPHATFTFDVRGLINTIHVTVSPPSGTVARGTKIELKNVPGATTVVREAKKHFLKFVDLELIARSDAVEIYCAPDDNAGGLLYINNQLVRMSSAHRYTYNITLVALANAPNRDHGITNKKIAKRIRQMIVEAWIHSGKVCARDAPETKWTGWRVNAAAVPRSRPAAQLPHFPTTSASFSASSSTVLSAASDASLTSTLHQTLQMSLRMAIPAARPTPTVKHAPNSLISSTVTRTLDKLIEHFSPSDARTTSSKVAIDKICTFLRVSTMVLLLTSVYLYPLSRATS